MSRLAIVIPATGTVAALEATLVSVLENRPRDCEVIVAANFAYDDPYQLQGDVRFVATPAKSSFVTCVQKAYEATQAPIVHLLATGCEVSEGWADVALAHFKDARVAAVAPLVLEAGQAEQVVSAGIEFGAGGKRRTRTGALEAFRAVGSTPVWGASFQAAFFRQSALVAAGGWQPTTSPALADVELAGALKQRGYETICEPRSLVQAPQQAEAREKSLRRGYDAERLFWQTAGQKGWLRSLVAHPWVVAAETLATLPSPRVLPLLAGRFWAACQYRRFVRQGAMTQTSLPQAEPVVAPSTPERIRLDAAHSVNQSRRAKHARSA